MSSRCPRVTITMYEDSFGSQAGHGVVEVLRDYFLGFGKALAAGVGFAVVDHGHVETGAFGDFIKIYRYVACAKYIK
jgi:hypothetical protein